ncbi:MAG: protein tyrosine phosphatase family protein [Pseudomonadota bacterium]
MSEITNFVQLTKLIGTSGQPSRGQFAEIATQEYSVVVNLAMPDSDHAIAEEGSIVTSLGMSYVHIPVPFDRPTVNHLRQFFGVMKAFDGKKVWVHCVMNWRVSAFMYHYLRIEKGLPDADCISPILREWEPRMEEVWRSFLGLDRDAIVAK